MSHSSRSGFGKNWKDFDLNVFEIVSADWTHLSYPDPASVEVGYIKNISLGKMGLLYLDLKQPTIKKSTCIVTKMVITSLGEAE